MITDSGSQAETTLRLLMLLSRLNCCKKSAPRRGIPAMSKLWNLPQGEMKRDDLCPTTNYQRTVSCEESNLVGGGKLGPGNTEMEALESIRNSQP